MSPNRMGLPKTGKYKKLVKHKRRPRKQTKAFSNNESYVSEVQKNGRYTKTSRLSGKTTKYTKTGRISKRQ